MAHIAVKYIIEPFSETVADLLVSNLTDIGYEGFLYDEQGFTAYIPEKQYREEDLQKTVLPPVLAEEHRISYEIEVIQERNWNKEWEDHFTPVLIDDQVLIRAGFHAKQDGIPYDIIIEPKMSFGTGHHPTTVLMIRAILEVADYIKGKKVLDMGCGTGILSIVSSKAGAKSVLGIDIDEWSFNNSRENMDNNGVRNMVVKIGDAGLLRMEGDFDVILANINRNILLDDMEKYVSHLSKSGKLLMSGFYTNDLPLIEKEATRLGMSLLSSKEENNWCAAIFTR